MLYTRDSGFITRISYLMVFSLFLCELLLQAVIVDANVRTVKARAQLLMLFFIFLLLKCGVESVTCAASSSRSG